MSNDDWNEHRMIGRSSQLKTIEHNLHTIQFNFIMFVHPINLKYMSYVFI